MLLQPEPLEEFGHALARHSAELNGRSLPSERQAADDAQESAAQLGKNHLPPVRTDVSGDFCLDLRNAGTGDHRLPPVEAGDQIGQKNKDNQPAGHAKAVSAAEIQHHAAPLVRLSQCKPVKRRDQSGGDADQNSLRQHDCPHRIIAVDDLPDPRMRLLLHDGYSFYSCEINP